MRAITLNTDIGVSFIHYSESNINKCSIEDSVNWKTKPPTNKQKTKPEREREREQEKTGFLWDQWRQGRAFFQTRTVTSFRQPQTPIWAKPKRACSSWTRLSYGTTTTTLPQQRIRAKRGYLLQVRVPFWRELQGIITTTMEGETESLPRRHCLWTYPIGPRSWRRTTRSTPSTGRVKMKKKKKKMMMMMKNTATLLVNKTMGLEILGYPHMCIWLGQEVLLCRCMKGSEELSKEETCAVSGMPFGRKLASKIN